tara:strand:+ start:1539 stop:5168 length:3630 start_codon:yes stop_codon:yes gene_type:complete
MSKYPKITGNNAAIAGSAKFDRLKPLNFAAIPTQSTSADINGGFLTKKLTDSNGKEFIYGIMILESSGTAGSSIEFSNLSVHDELGDASQIGDSLNTETQNALFCVTPKKRTAISTWTDHVPFMGLTAADYSTSELYTQDLLDVSATLGAGQAYKDAATGAAVFIKASVSTSGVVDLLPASIASADTDAFIPIYDHEYILANPIPTGHYAAVLIKCDVTGGIFDSTKTFKFRIGHNGINEINGSAADYQIGLVVTGENIFESQVLLNNSVITSGVSTGTIFSRMMPISVDQWSGFSWPTDSLAANQYLVGLGLSTASTDTTPPQGTGTAFETPADAFAIWSNFVYITPHTEANRTELFHGTNVVKMFSEKSLIARDASVIGEDFRALNVDTGSGTLFSHSTTPTALEYTNVQKDADWVQGFRHNLVSPLTTAGTHTKDALTGVYPDFVVDDIKETQTSTVSLENVVGSIKSFVTDVEIPYVVYPLFTYPASTISKSSKNTNAANKTTVYEATTGANTNQYWHEHADTTYTSFEPSSGGGLSPVKLTGTQSSFLEVSGLRSYHNLRINCLSSEDELGFNGISGDGTNFYSANGTARATTNGDITKTGAEVANTLCPTTAQQYLDYTIDDLDTTMISQFVTPSQEYYPRGDGNIGYADVDNIEGFNYTTKSFNAPITAWTPGLAHGHNVGTSLVPYFYAEWAPPVPYTINLGFYNSRPLLHLGWEEGQTAPLGVERLEFIAPGTSTATSLTDGVFDYSGDGSGVYREVSYPLRSVQGTNVLHAVTGDDSDELRVSYVPGMEIFGLDTAGAFASGRHFIHSITPYAANTEGNTVRLNVVDKDGADVNATVSVETFTVTIGKPTVLSTTRNTSFTHDATADIKVRDRVNFPYGSDISWRIENTEADYIVAGDAVYVEEAGTSTSDLLNLQSTSLAATGNVFTANSALSSASTQGDKLAIYNFGPTEPGIVNNNEPFSSTRLASPSSFVPVDVEEGVAAPMFYTTLEANNFAGNAFSTTIDLYPFNEGEEDVLLIDAELFDPYYLPEGVFLNKPAGSNTPTYTITNLSKKDGVTTNFGVTSVGSTQDVLTSAADNSGDTTVLHRLQRNNFSINTTMNDRQDTIVSIGFSVATNGSVAGDYYKVVEFSYYRDIASTQKRPEVDSWTFRDFGDRPVWKTRKLIRFSVNSVSQILISDSDETTLSSTSQVNFGNITA